VLVLSTGNCDKCGSIRLPLTEQEASVTCKKCGEELKICGNCKPKGCQCGGKLESQMNGLQKTASCFSRGTHVGTSAVTMFEYGDPVSRYTLLGARK